VETEKRGRGDNLDAIRRYKKKKREKRQANTKTMGPASCRLIFIMY
jgi:hypothetical protein